MGYVVEAAGTALGAVGMFMGSQAQASAGKFNARMAEQNAALAARNETIATQSGAQQTFNQQMKNRADVAELKTQQASSGVDINTGSFADVQESAETLGMLDAMTVRSNATRDAYGYSVQEANFKADAAMERASASNALTAGYINTGATLLSGGSKAYSKYKEGKGFGF